MDISANIYTLRDLRRINVILGKNGSGKSTLLKQMDLGISQQNVEGAVRYITPERGGMLAYEANIEQSHTANVGWMQQTRRVNQYSSFRQQTVVQYRLLETRVLRALERGYMEQQSDLKGFDSVIDQINLLLDNIVISRGAGPIFDIKHKSTGQALSGGDISSGEAELVSLAIECLAFSQEVIEGKRNVLFIDEPDVHLHPDLQVRLTDFLKILVIQYKFTIVMATHSTAMLSGLTEWDQAAIALMRSGDRTLTFEPIDEVYRKVLPVFGAHPLSNIFNESPVLLVEGEDDVRIWQQAIRSSRGKIRVYPTECGGLSNFHEFEERIKQILNAVYDDATAFSLRDRDEGPEAIDDDMPLVRMRLSCRAPENLLLTDEVLSSACTDWPTVRARIEKWLSITPDHPKRKDVLAFKANSYDRKTSDLKQIRMLLVGEMIASNKPWEVLVGQAIGEFPTGTGAHSMREYLGAKTVRNLLEEA